MPILYYSLNKLTTWIENETEASELKDERLTRRFKTVLKQLGGASAETFLGPVRIGLNTKAAYRFFDNERVGAGDILAGHFRATRERFAGTSAVILVLHGTTEFSYQRENIGLLHKPRLGPSARWQKENPICGLSMHSSLAIATSGLPLGLAAIRFWTRNKFKGTEALKRLINSTRVPVDQKESMRWIDNVRDSTELLGEGERCVHIGDRESDIFELFCAAQQSGTYFLVRTCVNRLCGNGECTVARQMETVKVKGLHRIEVRDDKGQTIEATLEIKYRRIEVRRPVGKQGKYPPLKLTVIHASERGKPVGRDRIEWKLLTDLPVDSCAQSIEKLQWYALRWKIEVFHKILKSGCKIEGSGLRTAERLINLIATCCILAWRIFWMTVIIRSEPHASPYIALTQLEMTILDRLCPDKSGADSSSRTLSDYILKIARLGGYMARARDPAASNTVIWRGLAHLTDITLGAALSSELVGN